MASDDRVTISKTPCPECGGKVEMWSFGTDCRGNAGFGGVYCTNCKMEFGRNVWSRIEFHYLVKSFFKKYPEKRAEVAAKFGISASSLRRWEDGSSVPHESFLPEVSKCFEKLLLYYALCET